jgi:HAD superfamily hydrolase (TIGR01484 family)
MKKVIAFDLDGTLAPSKSPLPDRIAMLITQLLNKFHVCIISGGNFSQFEKQLLSNLKLDNKQYKNLHLMPTCGTKYYIFENNKKWKKIYSEDIPASDKIRIKKALLDSLEKFGFREDKVYGELVEDRGSQLTLSTLGQDIVEVLGSKGVMLKEEWDPDSSKKNKIRDFVADLIPDYEVKVGGLTSIDVTRTGIDKAYGMRKLMDHLELDKDEILFIGDRLKEGGNDFPVKAMGIDSIEISDWHQTAIAVEAIIHLAD